ncbi:type II toxin-antitoxin system RelE family toxin [Bordetella genomosp. 8]|uniref:type II toxin-antitoxin system RelE family toxin n=1 Tax=Bordetella genomosp. 8 TaxID=1416806 RepID=UPI001E2C0E82|nr:type II toxin-antitoxin system RelE/ParE family toxin [Bordetella genomosp. 8]
MYTINWTKKAVKQLLRIAPRERSRIATAVNALIDPANVPNVLPLSNHQYGYRLRVGDYRVLFDVALSVRHRGDPASEET